MIEDDARGVDSGTVPEAWDWEDALRSESRLSEGSAAFSQALHSLIQDHHELRLPVPSTGGGQ